MENDKNKYILAKFDVSGIQDYIFATNRLRENAGASYQVTRIMEEFLVQSFQEAADKENMIDVEWKESDGLHLPEDENILAEIIYIGGGNGVALFRDMDFFRRVGSIFGKKIATECQGVYLAAAYIETDLKNFAEDRKKLDQEMNNRKHHMIRQPAYSPFPVVEQEDGSHQPITDRIIYNQKTENVTRIQAQKRNAYKKISGYKRLFPELKNEAAYEYPEEMDQLSRERGEDSMVAVVHIDGNGMGDRMNGLLEGYKEQREYSKDVSKIRDESKKISGLFSGTYRAVLQDLWDDKIFAAEKEAEKKKEIFPMRPILMDGDDFTFICRADLAVPIAAGFMRKLLQMQQEEEKKITACGGIAFVHSHFPFRVAYSIAEKSCGQAKNAWYQKKREGKNGVETCFLDFQVIKESEVGFSLKGKEYQKRPYSLRLEENGENEDSLKALCDILKEMDENWPSGRLHKIYRAYQEGNTAMEFLEKEFESRGYEINKLAMKEWKNSPLYDALELQGMCRFDLLEKFINVQGGQADEGMESTN